MQSKDKRICVAVSFGEGGTVYGCGHALDTFLYAYGLATEESLFEWIGDREHEAINDVLREYDWEAYTLERLNALPTMAHEEEYLHGDYLRFERPESFKEAVREDKGRITDLVREQIGDWSSEAIPSDLRKELMRAMDYVSDEARHEWLHGDRSSAGVLAELARALFGRYASASVDWSPRTDVVTIEADAEEWREWLGYDLGDGEPVPSSQEIGERLKADALRRAEALMIKVQRESESRKAEYARREAFKASQLEEEKAKARERKHKKIRAS